MFTNKHLLWNYYSFTVNLFNRLRFTWIIITFALTEPLTLTAPLNVMSQTETIMSAPVHQEPAKIVILHWYYTRVCHAPIVSHCSFCFSLSGAIIPFVSYFHCRILISLHYSIVFLGEM